LKQYTQYNSIHMMLTPPRLRNG